MPFDNATDLGPLETFLARVAPVAEDIADIQVTFDSDIGVPTRVSVQGDAMASSVLIAQWIFGHLLEETRHPVVRAFLLDAMARIGV